MRMTENKHILHKHAIHNVFSHPIIKNAWEQKMHTSPAQFNQFLPFLRMGEAVPDSNLHPNLTTVRKRLVDGARSAHESRDAAPVGRAPGLWRGRRGRGSGNRAVDRVCYRRGRGSDPRYSPTEIVYRAPEVDRFRAVE